MSLVSVESLQNFTYSVFLACEICPQYIQNSFLFTVPFKERDLREKIRKINLQQSLQIICYDKGNMHSASRVYCYLLATGYENVKVLYGGLRACVDNSYALTSEIPETIPVTERNLLGLKENFIIGIEEFVKMNTKGLNTVYANFLNSQIYSMHACLSKENVQRYLNECKVRIESVKNAVFYGELSTLLAVFAHFLGVCDFSVVVVDFDCASYGVSRRSSSKETVYVSLGELSSLKSMNSVELDHYNQPGVKSTRIKGSEESENMTPCCNCTLL